ncbi:MAG: HAD-IIA family hydrolase [Bacteroidales bacterium]|jgi:NagD protein|nr:HAD-IIA family hydrolase [Bacteroidales bacterium]
MINLINSAAELTDNAAMSAKLHRIRHVALDMDGTIYNGSTLFPWTKEFIADIEHLGITYSFLTNNPSKNTEDYLAHLHSMGLDIPKNSLYTSANATVDYLRRNHPDVKRLFILGTPSMVSGFETAGFVSVSANCTDEPDAVLVGFDKTLEYNRLCRAAWWIDKGKKYFATNPDLVCPTDLPTILVDCGAICAALEKATGRKPDITMGKPDPEMLNGIRLAKGLNTDQIAMVGDRIYTDLKMAANSGALGVLVLSGEASLDDARNADFNIDIVTDTLGIFGKLLAATH